MGIRGITWKEKVRAWRNSPEKLLAFIEGLLWEAKIDPDSNIVWGTDKGKVTLWDNNVWFEESKEANKK